MKKQALFLPLLLGMSLLLIGCGSNPPIETPPEPETTRKPLTKEACIEKSVAEIKKIPEIAELLTLYEETIQDANTPTTLLGYNFELSSEDEFSFTLSLTEQHEDHEVKVAHVQVNKYGGEFCLEDMVTAECEPQNSDPAYIEAFTQQCQSLSEME